MRDMAAELARTTDLRRRIELRNDIARAYWASRQATQQHLAKKPR